MDETGAIVSPLFPRALAKTAGNTQGRLTRLELARWIASRDNPLTARVFMNRLWKQFFGAGLSRTLDDLGSQGEWPDHPELLDWLACEFMDQGWNVKEMVRAIVTSRTYRQASTVSKEALARSQQPLSRPPEPVPPRRRTGSRQRPGRLGSARHEDRRTERETVSAGRLLGKPQFSAARSTLPTPGRTSIAAVFTPGGSDPFCTRACWRSTPRVGKNAWPSAAGRTFLSRPWCS